MRLDSQAQPLHIALVNNGLVPKLLFRLLLINSKKTEVLGRFSEVLERYKIVSLTLADFQFDFALSLVNNNLHALDMLNKNQTTCKACLVACILWIYLEHGWKFVKSIKLPLSES